MNFTANNYTIEYDKNIILKLKEMIENGLKKLKSFVKFNKKGNLDFYNDLKERFNNIASKLKELELWDELKYFISISHYVEYIVYQNSLDSSFGYCSFAIELLNFYLDYIKVNFDYYLNLSIMNIKEFNEFQKGIKRKHRIYRRKFFEEIYQLSGEYTLDELYKMHESLRE